MQKKELSPHPDSREEEVFVLSGKKRHYGYAGGVFYELGRAVLDKGGVIVGAAYTEDFRVEHMVADNEKKLIKLTGVKYAESNISDETKKIVKEILKAGQPLLFSGTSCQIEIMQRYLDEEYDNFYTVAVGCSGVIKSTVWEDYIAETQSHGSVITEMYFPYRGKFGISQNKVMIKFRHGTAYFRDEKEDKLFKLKNAGLVYKEECYQCPWVRKHVKTDIFLEIHYESGRNDAVQEEGLTKVSIYSDKGKRLISKACSRMHFYKEPFRDQNNLCSVPLKPLMYNYFWDYYNHYGFSFASELMISQVNSFLQDRVLLDFFKKYTMLDVKGISAERILDNWGLEKVILYGCGTIGKMISDKLEQPKRIYAVIDQKVQGNRQNKISVSEEEAERIRNSELPIVLGPDCFLFDSMAELEGMGISRKRILPLRFLVNQEYDEKILKGSGHTAWNREKGGVGNIYLITGAQFANKGAQSMLFVTVSELKQKHPDCDIYYFPIDYSAEKYPDSLLGQYRFHIIRDWLGMYSQLYDLLPQVKAIVDISGYALASKWNCSHFVHILLLAQNNKIPIYLMPQSFGPLDFEEEWDKKIRKGLEHAEVIFAREKKGYDLLLQKYCLKNLRMSRDLVLQNRELHVDHIRTKKLRPEEYRLKTDGNVAVIPNFRTYEFGNKSELLEAYRNIITELLRRGKNVYILSHSEDGFVCRDIYQMFFENEHVFLYEKKLDCLEYSVLAKEFQYIAAARYHAIVHAYKVGTPCIVIGWAEKYRELADLFDQGEYVFDVCCGIDMMKLMKAVNQMDEAWVQEKKKIMEILPALQAENCFDVIA